MLLSNIFHGAVAALLLCGTAVAAPTCNIPSNRACWSPGFTINTDYETATPLTGVTRTVSHVSIVMSSC